MARQLLRARIAPLERNQRRPAEVHNRPGAQSPQGEGLRLLGGRRSGRSSKPHGRHAGGASPSYNSAMEIALTRGFVAVVDDDDYALLSSFKWCAVVSGHSSDCVYAGSYVRSSNGGQRLVLMHRLVAGAELGDVVDHIDRDGLNNRRENLRICSRGENNRNTKQRASKSGIRNVRQERHTSSGELRWRAYVAANGVRRRRWFRELDRAIEWVSKTRRELHGQFVPNDIDGQSRRC